MPLSNLEDGSWTWLETQNENGGGIVTWIWTETETATHSSPHFPLWRTKDGAAKAAARVRRLTQAA